MNKSKQGGVLTHEKEIFEHEKTIARLKAQNQESGIWSESEIASLEEKIEQLKKTVYSNLSPWERVEICRHVDRPRTVDYIQHLCTDFTEIHGDRLHRDDCAIITGFACIGERRFMVVGQEKGCDTKSRLYRNFGMPYPEGYRKAMRAMRLAAKFSLPVLTLLDTPGAYPGLEAEERGQGSAIANNLWEMARLPTPIISILIGEGCSGGALGIGVSDRLAMLEHSYYSVISPEGCASILWRDNTQASEAASALKMHVEDLLKWGIVDQMIKEPPGGAHHDPKDVYKKVQSFILSTAKQLSSLSVQELLHLRYQKYRKLGAFTIA